MPKAALWVFKRFWPPALAQQAPQAINPAALQCFRGAAPFRGLAPVFKPERALLAIGPNVTPSNAFKLGATGDSSGTQRDPGDKIRPQRPLHLRNQLPIP